MKNFCEHVHWGPRVTKVNCRNKAKVEHDGKSYCGTHDPVRIAAKKKLREAAWQREYDVQQATQKQAAKNKLANARRLKLFPQLVEELKKVEWKGEHSHGDGEVCPTCRNFPRDGHTKTCTLRWVLNLAEALDE